MSTIDDRDTPPFIGADEFDRMFDDGEDITPYLDLANARRPGLEKRTVVLDLLPTTIEAAEAESATEV